MTIVVLIITENPNIVLWLGELLQAAACDFTQEVYGFRVGKNLTIQLCDKITEFINTSITHIIYLIDVEDLSNVDVIHYHTTAESKEELREELAKIKWVTK